MKNKETLVKEKIAILGASGMLGSMMVQYFARQDDCQVIAYVRDKAFMQSARQTLPDVEWRIGAYEAEHRRMNFPGLEQCAWVLNAIGITKPLIKEDRAEQIERALLVNSLFPNDLGKWADANQARVLQIATDCVYSGRKGAYVETDIHDAEDIYGKTKSLGESYWPSIAHLRCSIVGPEAKDFKFLLEWFLRQKKAAAIKGFSNHQWNGITTLHYAKLCHGIIRNKLELPHLQHLVPRGTISKAEMLRTFARCYDRTDIIIEEVNAGQQIDRTLSTLNHARNRRLWECAGYTEPPTVPQMIEELSNFKFTPLL